MLQSAGDEQPSRAGMERTLAALGVSGALLTSAGGATAAAGATASATKVVTATLLAKWIGVGVVGGIALSGAAAAVSPAPTASSAAAAARPARAAPRATAVPAVPSAAPASIDVPAAPVVEVASVAASARPVDERAVEPRDVVVEVGAPLAAEVAFIDRARARLAAGQAEQGLAQLRDYEREFPEARLLPEVLFLRMETCDRLGRADEARMAATRLLDGFPKSPHAARARRLLSH